MPRFSAAGHQSLEFGQKIDAVALVGIQHNDDGIDAWRPAISLKQLRQSIKQDSLARIDAALQVFWNAAYAFICMRRPCVRIALLAKQFGQYRRQEFFAGSVLHQEFKVHVHLASR